ncbi:L-lactate dehydrogenase [Paenibacillus glycanilyticus]|uniref:L-lactate dehydrogenase n=1 Tax=Paenibacillus glycanilyticus TaxID=126569 RepID=A0ABQ6GCY8_9BACL|nr:L-lactate dehydrogenase [Paenibacillus glycanilyticus]GLX68829.1 L-lactate dehydrogenase 3 [Paenibacillus glycanilyticus]
MRSKARKVAIAGVGNVGSSCAYSLINQSICDEIMLIGRTPDRAVAQALDLSHGMDFVQSRTRIYTGTYEDCTDMDVVILCAGGYPTEGKDRIGTLSLVYDIYKDMIPRIMNSGFQGIVLAAANPVDVVTYMVWKLSGLPRGQVIGTGTSIDSSRLKTLLCEHFPVDPRSVHGYVLGEHGESQFPAWSHVTIGGKPIRDILAQHPARFGHVKLEKIAEQTKNAGWEIFTRKGSTHYGIGNALAYITRSILNDEHRIIAVSAVLEQEYGQSGLAAGVPAIITRSGVKEIVELNLTPLEEQQMNFSCRTIRNAIEQLSLG